MHQCSFRTKLNLVSEKAMGGGFSSWGWHGGGIRRGETRRGSGIFCEKKLYYPACALSALGLLLSVSASQWGGARLFAASEGHPHGNGRNSETKSRKIDPKVPKNVTLLDSNHVPVTTGQCCPKEKVPFYQIINGE